MSAILAVIRAILIDLALAFVRDARERDALRRAAEAGATARVDRALDQLSEEQHANDMADRGGARGVAGRLRDRLARAAGRPG